MKAAKLMICVFVMLILSLLSAQTCKAETPFTGSPTNVKDDNSASDAATQANNSEKNTDKSYTIESGDCLWAIAARFLGDGNRYRELVELNASRYPSLRENPNLIYPGWNLILPTSASEPITETVDFTDEGTVSVGGDILNVRTSPWGKIIGSLSDDDKVDIIGKSGDWYKIKYGSGFAYVHSDYVSTTSKPAAAASKSAPASASRSGGAAAPCSPMPSHTSSEFGPRNLFGHDFHNGIDLPVPTGTQVNALWNGVVTGVGYEPGGGNFVKIRYDNGYESFMCHLRKSSVSVGQRVSAGQQVASSDNTGAWTTGAHLHLGIKKNGSYINPRFATGIPLPPK